MQEPEVAGSGVSGISRVVGGRGPQPASAPRVAEDGKEGVCGSWGGECVRGCRPEAVIASVFPATLPGVFPVPEEGQQTSLSHLQQAHPRTSCESSRLSGYGLQGTGS